MHPHSPSIRDKVFIFEIVIIIPKSPINNFSQFQTQIILIQDENQTNGIHTWKSSNSEMALTHLALTSPVLISIRNSFIVKTLHLDSHYFRSRWQRTTFRRLVKSPSLRLALKQLPVSQECNRMKRFT
ncbi:unnamed protein product [Hermetia illucens]|uniref:Uncharacterized protein n=1 Tax=Hermetia illucens TaxID=343691 RepID=A0A7R8UBB3_HERIL|nr:unnamed protein product [Hermetia illucens]